MRRAVPIVFALLASTALTLLLVRLFDGASQAVTTGVTLAATMLMTAATVALAWFALVQVQDARREQRGVAAALLQEVARIRTELGARPRHGENPRIIDSHTAGAPEEDPAIVTDAITPEIHPWFHRLIPEIAESDAAVVGLFLTLDRHLFNYRDRVRLLVGAQAAARQRREILEQWVRDHPKASPMDDVMRRQDAEHALRLAEANLGGAEGMAITLYRACHDTLYALERSPSKLS